jgi:hypothetical protein
MFDIKRKVGDLAETAFDIAVEATSFFKGISTFPKIHQLFVIPEDSVSF